MVNLTVEKVRDMMFDPESIRNISIIAQVGHGRSTLSESLIAKAGIIAIKPRDEHAVCGDDDRDNEVISIKQSDVSLFFRYLEMDYIVNLIDSSKRLDPSSDVTAALRVSDGALVVVDCAEGVGVQTEVYLRQAMQEKIKPVLMISKVDKAILALKLDPESVYKNFAKIIERVNVVVSNLSQPDMGSVELDPARGNVAFGSGKHCWGFTVKRFADIYSKGSISTPPSL